MTETRKLPALWTHPAIVIPVFLIVVNLACGFIAVEFRYPSLWGVRDVFKEYALPLNLSWAAAHWPSMIILSVLLFRMRGWDEAQITRIRCVFLAGIALCIATEFIYGGGKFHRIPFVLFVLVDLSVAFGLSLLLHQRRRPFVALLLLLVVLLIGAAPTLRFEYQKYLYDQKRIKAIEREAERTRQIRNEESTIQNDISSQRENSEFK